jgi:hypothetical protein
MMMEEEIEQIKEEMRGIEVACEKVEQILEKVVQAVGVDSVFSENNDENTAKEEDEGKMEEILQESKEEGQAPANSGPNEQKWFEDERLLNLWNGNTL